MKGNYYRKLYGIDRFCRLFCCQHHRLTVLRNDKHAAKKASRANAKKEIQEGLNDV